MKKIKTVIIGITVLMLQFSNGIFAQSNSDGSTPQFLFPEFIQGVVKMTNGLTQKILLNYNTVTEKMVYQQNEKVYDMINTEKIDTVFIYESKFVPSGKLFYEVLLAAPVSLFIQHKGSIVPPGKPAAYGGTSQVSSSNYQSGVQLPSGYYNLALPANYQVKMDPVFWIRKDNNMHDFINEKQFLKIFPEREAELKAYIKKYHVKFSRIPDVIRLAEYLNDGGRK
jgi:hypothetical protein